MTEKVNKDDFQLSAISNWVIGDIDQDEKSWGSDQVWGVTRFGELKVVLVCHVSDAYELAT